MNFLLSQKVQRYHDLYNKFYIGYTVVRELREELALEESMIDDIKVVVALEKKHTNEIELTYYIWLSKKSLYLYSYENGKWNKEKKDPYGITITEVYHINKMMDESYALNKEQLSTIANLLSTRVSSIIV